MAFRIPWSVFLIPKRKIPGSTSKNYSDSGGEKLELREELLSTPPSAKIRIVFQANSVQVATNKSSIVSQKMPGLICHRLEFKSSIVLNSMSKATQPSRPPPPQPPCKRKRQDSNGFWIPRCGVQIPGTKFQSLSVKLRFWIPIVRGILDSLSYIPNSKVQDCGFHKQKIPGLRNLDSLKRGDRRPYWLPPISSGF